MKSDLTGQSPLEQDRLRFQPTLPDIFKHLNKLELSISEDFSNLKGFEKLRDLFPHTFDQPILRLRQGEKRTLEKHLKVGVVLSGGQAPGGHNVIAGLFDALKSLHPKSQLFGFLGGPDGIIDHSFREIDQSLIDRYRNTGGFDIIGSGRGKIETPEQLEIARQIMEEIQLDGLVIIGGDDSNTNAAVLAEYFLAQGCSTRVIGVPKTIDGDLKMPPLLETSFGFDTTCKVYSEMIGNIARDAMSSGKYYHFIRLMGRSASHIVLECALQTHPNIALIGEEILAENKTLSDITMMIADMVCERANQNLNHGVILLPEGLIEFIPEIKKLIQEINGLLAKHVEQKDLINKLSADVKKTFDFLPEKIQNQLLLTRDPHGNVPVSQIETESLLIETVKKELKKRSSTYKGTFSPLAHFFGYEGRSAFPSNFDANYCFALGYMASVLILNGVTGYMSVIGNLTRPVSDWEGRGIPLILMMHFEERKGKVKPVIKKALVDLEGGTFTRFSLFRKKWQLEDHYRYPGPVQFYGPSSICDATTATLYLDQAAKVTV